jgi:hypothetical protein
MTGNERLGKHLDWAVGEARRLIHDNDVERLKPLLAGFPALLSWDADDDAGGLAGGGGTEAGDEGFG